jgi:hypothetical protein
MVCICQETREGDAVPTTLWMHNISACSGSERQGKSAEQFVNSAPKDKQRPTSRPDAAGPARQAASAWQLARVPPLGSTACARRGRRFA